MIAHEKPSLYKSGSPRTTIVSRPVVSKYLSSTPFMVAISCLSSYCRRAFSSIVYDAEAMKSHPSIADLNFSSGTKVFPCTGLTFMSGSNELLSLVSKSSKPLNTDMTITSAAVPTATPKMEMMEMMFIALRDFFDIKYRDAM